MTDELKNKLTERFEFLAKRSEEQVSADIYDALLKAYLAGGEYGYQYAQEPPAWVSVKKELPRERGHYLAYTEYGQVWLTEYMQDKGGYWDWFVAPICVGAVSKVTHWMPLPTLPVKKGGNDE